MKSKSPIKSEAILAIVQSALEDVKGKDIVVLDVRQRCSFTDFMVISSGTSDRHVRAQAERVAEKAKEVGVSPLGVEDSREGGWVLVDLVDVVVHVMRPEVRQFYNLEKLWSV